MRATDENLHRRGSIAADPLGFWAPPFSIPFAPGLEVLLYIHIQEGVGRRDGCDGMGGRAPRGVVGAW